jgi:hypothetical protein
MLSAIMLDGVMLDVVMLSVVAPLLGLDVSKLFCLINTLA